MRRPSSWGEALVLQAAAAAVAGVASTLAWAVGGAGYFWPRWVLFGCGAALALQLAVRAGVRAPAGWERGFAVHSWLTLVIVPADIVIWLLSGLGWFWPGPAAAPFGVAIGVHAWILWRRAPDRERELAERVDVLTRSRRGAVDVQAAELKRIERDLHDGAQARMVSLAIKLGLAEEAAGRDPAAAAALVAEARQGTLAALDELRTVMRGIQPPVLSDRGLVGAVEALALDLAVPTTVVATLDGRPPTPVESAVYLAVAECLANVVKHSGARAAWVVLRHAEGLLTATVGDDGAGGADPARGTGLAGVARRLDVFDGTLEVSSPAGGPTDVTMEVPCALSSRRTSPSSGTA